jgi:hypothetical protein
VYVGQNLMKFAKIFMPECLKMIYTFFFFKKTKQRVIFKILIGFFLKKKSNKGLQLKKIER